MERSKYSFLLNSTKLIAWIFFVLILQFALNNCSVKQEYPKFDWGLADSILNNISEPQFPEREFLVNDFGAESDLNFDSRPSIQAAIDSISAIGGGKITIPSGNYYSAGTIFLKDNVNLHISEGALLKFSTNSKDYLPVVLSRWEGVECYNYSALLYANGKSNIGITGKGILDGSASSENWWPWKGKTEYGFVSGMPSQLDSAGRPLLLKMNNNQTPVNQRIFGDGAYLRPNFVQLMNCKNILIENITLKDSPMWFLHPVLSENLIVRGVTVVGKGPNNDGLDPESCKNVLIEDCFFDTGDDCIAIKSGRNNDGRRISTASENILVRNCRMNDGHGGVVIGSEISGGCKNIFVQNCQMDSPNLDRAIRIKTNTIRGGIVENIFVRDIKIGVVKEAILRINLKYEPKEIGERNFLPTVRNIFLQNIESEKSTYALYLEGLKDSKIKNIVIKNSNLKGVEKGNILREVKDLIFEEVYINNELF